MSVIRRKRKVDVNTDQLTQKERQLLLAYIQGKYDALLELMVRTNSNTTDILKKIETDIDHLNPVDYSNLMEGNRAARNMKDDILQIINKYMEKEDDRETKSESG